MIKSENINELATALVKAQTEMTSAIKDSKAHAYKYADLGAVIEAVKPALNKHGISFTQLIEDSDANTVKVTTLLIHSSGQYIGSTGSTGIPEMRGCNEAQRAGAAQSYLKRYQLQALTGLPTEDNDASSDGFKNNNVNNNKPVVVEQPKVEAPKKGFGVAANKKEVVNVNKVETTGSEDSWS
jgi:hypothetical protein